MWKPYVTYVAFISPPHNQYLPPSKTYTLLDNATLDVIFLFETNMKYLLKQNIPVIYVLLCYQKLSKIFPFVVNHVFIFWFLIHRIVSAQVCGFWPLSIIRLFPGGSTWPLSIIRRTSYLVLQTSNQLSQSVDLRLKSFFSHLNSSWQRQKGTVNNLQIVSMMFYSSRHLKPRLSVAVIAIRQGESNVQTLLLSLSHYLDYNGRFHIAFCQGVRWGRWHLNIKRSTEIHVFSTCTMVLPPNTMAVPW